MMRKDDEVHRRTAMVLMRHGPLAADFAAMVAVELAKSGDNEGSKTWSAVSREAKSLLSDMPSRGWQSGTGSALPSGHIGAYEDATHKH